MVAHPSVSFSPGKNTVASASDKHRFSMANDPVEICVCLVTQNLAFRSQASSLADEQSAVGSAMLASPQVIQINEGMVGRWTTDGMIGRLGAAVVGGGGGVVGGLVGGIGGGGGGVGISWENLGGCGMGSSGVASSGTVLERTGARAVRSWRC